MSANPIHRFEAFLLDLDGCLYRGKTAIPGAPTVIKRLKDLGKKIVFLTNNSSFTPAAYARKLKSMGFEASAHEFITSGLVTGEYLVDKYGSSYTYVIGSPALKQALTRFRHRVLLDNRSQEADFVVVGIDFSLTYQKLDLACKAIQKGAKLVATNADPTLPTETGFRPGAGSIVAALQTTTGAKPLIIGKPAPHMIHAALKKIETTREKTCIIGDRIDTDILAGKNAGLSTIHVLTGSRKTSADKKKIRPDLVLRSISSLLRYL